MNSENSDFYSKFIKNINSIENNINYDNKYITNLLFANIITAFEVYLQNIFIYLLNNDEKLLKKLTTSSKYKKEKITLENALKSDIKVYLTERLKKLVFHNLSDIEPLFREVLGVQIKFDIKLYNRLLGSVKVRHDIIHRNSFNKDGVKVEISKEKMESNIKNFTKIVQQIDKQIIGKYGDCFKK